MAMLGCRLLGGVATLEVPREGAKQLRPRIFLPFPLPAFIFLIYKVLTGTYTLTERQGEENSTP